MVKSRENRSSVSLVCKDWYDAEQWSRRQVFIGKCYSASPEIVTRRFRSIRSLTLKGKPRFSDFNLVPPNWGCDVQPWLEVFASEYPLMEELRLKRMTVTDESLEFLAASFPGFKALSLLSCDGFSTDGLAAMATHCKKNYQSRDQFYALELDAVLDTVEDKGLEAVGSNCPLIEELRVFPSGPYGDDIIRGVTESGFVAVSYGCQRLRYVLYFCRQMTNAAVATVVKNCPDFTHFRLCIMHPGQPDHITNEPMDEGFGAVVKTCTKLQRLAVSGLLTDHTFEYIGEYAKNLETLSVAFAGKSDWGMQCVLNGCPKLKKLEIRDCSFGNAALLSGFEKYESMRSLWMSACNVTMNACRLLASEMPRLNVEVMKDDGNDDDQADKVYVYRSVAGARRDAPPFVLTF